MNPEELTNEQRVPLYGLPGQERASQDLRRSMDPHVAAAIRCRVRDRQHQEDCMSETWLCVFRSKHTFRPDGQPDSARRWICTIAHRVSLTHIRKEAVRGSREKLASTLGEDNRLADIPDPTHSHVAQALFGFDETIQAIRRLPLMDQAILMLRVAGKLNQEHCALLIGYANAGAICERCQAIRERLQADRTRQLGR
jgi:RNA polymerase sigma factor (sigma-70 family)